MRHATDGPIPYLRILFTLTTALLLTSAAPRTAATAERVTPAWEQVAPGV